MVVTPNEFLDPDGVRETTVRTDTYRTTERLVPCRGISSGYREKFMAVSLDSLTGKIDINPSEVGPASTLPL